MVPNQRTMGGQTQNNRNARMIATACPVMRRDPGARNVVAATNTPMATSETGGNQRKGRDSSFIKGHSRCPKIDGKARSWRILNLACPSRTSRHLQTAFCWRRFERDGPHPSEKLALREINL